MSMDQQVNRGNSKHDFWKIVLDKYDVSGQRHGKTTVF